MTTLIVHLRNASTEAFHDRPAGEIAQFAVWLLSHRTGMFTADGEQPAAYRVEDIAGFEVLLNH